MNPRSPVTTGGIDICNEVFYKRQTSAHRLFRRGGGINTPENNAGCLIFLSSSEHDTNIRGVWLLIANPEIIGTSSIGSWKEHSSKKYATIYTNISKTPCFQNKTTNYKSMSNEGQIHLLGQWMHSSPSESLCISSSLPNREVPNQSTKGKYQLILVTPVWQDQHWYPVIMQISVSNLVLLPRTSIYWNWDPIRENPIHVIVGYLMLTIRIIQAIYAIILSSSWRSGTKLRMTPPGGNSPGNTRLIHSRPMWLI